MLLFFTSSITWQPSSDTCIQSWYLQYSRLSNISFMLSRMAILLIPIKSILEKPGVSTMNVLWVWNSSVCLVVCFPLPRAYYISAVLRFRLGSMVFSRVDFPAPLWPVKTTVFSLILFNKSTGVVDTIYPICW